MTTFLLIAAAVIPAPVEARKPHAMKIETVQHNLQMLNKSAEAAKTLRRRKRRGIERLISKQRVLQHDTLRRLQENPTSVLDLENPVVGAVGAIDARITARVAVIEKFTVVDLHVLKREYTGGIDVSKTSDKYVPIFFLIPIDAAAVDVLSGRWKVGAKKTFSIEVERGVTKDGLEGFVLKPAKKTE